MSFLEDARWLSHCQCSNSELSPYRASFKLAHPARRSKYLLQPEEIRSKSARSHTPVAFQRERSVNDMMFGILMTDRERAIICNRIYAGMT